MNDTRIKFKKNKQSKGPKTTKIIINNKTTNKRKKRRPNGSKGGYKYGAFTNISQPVNLRHLGQFMSKKQLQNYIIAHEKKNRIDYMVGMLYPDIAQKNQLIVKCYSDLHIPSCTFSSHTYGTYSTNASGNALFSWRPKLFLTSADNALYSNVTHNNAVTLTGTASNSNNFFQQTAYSFGVTVLRYRLVSALARFTYVGPVLNQSGVMYGCACFDNFGVGRQGVDTDASVDQYGNFQVIANGLWGQTAYINSDTTCMEFLYIPMDPDDLLFEKRGVWYDVGLNNPATFITPGSEGSHINYVCAFNGTAANLACVKVDIYSNYEVIVDSTVAPIVRTEGGAPSKEDHDTLLDYVNKSAPEIMVKSNTDRYNGSEMLRYAGKNKLHDSYIKDRLAMIDAGLIKSNDYYEKECLNYHRKDFNNDA